jgi:hypothetical protein
VLTLSAAYSYPVVVEGDNVDFNRCFLSSVEGDVIQTGACSLLLGDISIFSLCCLYPVVVTEVYVDLRGAFVLR